MELNDILKIALKGGASDIHLKPGLPPMFRLDGALVPLKNGERLAPEEVQQMAFGIMNPVQKARFELREAEEGGSEASAAQKSTRECVFKSVNLRLMAP